MYLTHNKFVVICKYMTHYHDLNLYLPETKF